MTEAEKVKKAELATEQAEKEKQAQLAAEQAAKEKQAQLAAEQAEKEKQAQLAAEQAAKAQEVTEDEYVCKRFTQIKVNDVILTYDVGMTQRFSSDQELNPLCWEKVPE